MAAGAPTPAECDKDEWKDAGQFGIDFVNDWRHLRGSEQGRAVGRLWKQLSSATAVFDTVRVYQ